MILGVQGATALFFLLAPRPAPDPSSLAGRWLAVAFGLWAAPTLILSLVGLGRLALRLAPLRGVTASRAPLPPLALGCGGFLLTVLLNAAAWLGWLESLGPVLWWAVLVPASFLGTAVLARRGGGQASGPPTGRRVVAAAVLLGAAVITPLLVQVMLPNTDWDGALYHIPLSERLLDGRVSEVDPLFEHMNFPGGQHLFYALLLSVGGGSAISPFNLALALALIVTLHLFTARFWGRRAAWWSAAVMAGTPLLWEVAVTPRVEVALALYLLVAVFAFIAWTAEPGMKPLLVISGMSVGVALGVKITALVPAGLLGLAILASSVFIARRPRRLWGTVLVAALLAILVCFPWYARNAVKLGNPVYPLLSGNVFRDVRWQAQRILRGLRHRVRVPDEEFQDLFRRRGIGYLMEARPEANPPRHLFNVWDILTRPERYERKPYHEPNPLTVLFPLLPLAARDGPSLWLLVLGLLSFAGIGWRTHLLRYALPALALFASGTGVILSRRRRLAAALAGIAVAAVLARTGAVEWSKVASLDPLRYLAGQESVVDFTARVGYNGARSGALMVRFVNGEVARGTMKATDVIFMVGEGKGHLLSCGYIPDESRLAQRWLSLVMKAGNDPRKIRRELRSLGVTHIAANYGYFHWVLRDIPVSSTILLNSLRHLQLFLEGRSEVVFDQEGLVLYRLTPLRKEKGER